MSKKLGAIQSFGKFGGLGGSKKPLVFYKSNGLKVWGGRHAINPLVNPPLFEGKVTIEMARELYEIENPILNLE